MKLNRVASAALVTGTLACTVISAPLASAAPQIDNDPATTATWVLSNPSAGLSVDLTPMLTNPEFVTPGMDIDKILAGVATDLETKHLPVTLTIKDSNDAVAGVSKNALGSAPVLSSSGGNQAAVKAAISQRGTPYVWGGSQPGGFDCSGLMQWSYAQSGKNIPRTSQAMASQGTPVSRADMQPGDIIVYYSGASHVGMYVGDNVMIDALGDGAPVDYRPVDYMPVHSIVRF